MQAIHWFNQVSIEYWVRTNELMNYVQVSAQQFSSQLD